MSDQVVVSTRLIGEIFVERGIVTREQLDEALAVQAANGGLLGEILVSSFGVSRLELATVLAEQWRAVDASGTSEPVPPAGASGPAVVAHPSPDPTPDVTRRPLGEIFVASGAVSETELERALERQRETGEKLGEILVAQGVIGRLELASALAEQWSELQVIRPPMPKEPEPWQETAVRSAVDGPADPVSPPSPDAAVPPATAAELAGLVDAVAELDLRVAELSHRQLPDIDAVRAEASALARRLDEIDARVVRAVDRSALEQLVVSIDELRAEIDHVRTGISADAELRSTIEALAARLEGLEHAWSDPQVDELAVALAALGARLDDLAGSDELRTEMRELDRRLGEIVVMAEQRAGSFDDRVRALEEHTKEHADAQSLRASLDELRARLDEVTAAVDRAPSADAVSALDSALSDALGRLAAELDVLARGAARREDVDAIRDALEGDLAALRQALAERPHDDERERLAGLESALADLARRVDDLVSEHAAPVDSVGPPPSDDAVRELDERLSILQVRLDEALAGRRDVEHVEEEIRGELQWVRGTIDELTSRIDAGTSIDVEGRLAEAASRAELGALAGDVRQRLDRLEAALAMEAPSGASEGVEARIAELGGSLAGLSERLDEVARSSEAAARPAEVEQRFSALEHALADADARATTGLGALHEKLESRLAEVASRAEVSGLAGELGTRVGTIEGLTTQLGARFDGELGALHGRLAEVVSRGELGEAWERIVGLESHVHEATARLDAGLADAVRRDELDGRITAHLSQFSADLSGLLEARIAEVSSRLVGIEGALAGADARLAAAADALQHDITSRLEQGVEREELAALEAGLVERIDARLGEIAGATNTHLDALVLELREATTVLHGRIDELAAGLGHTGGRLAAVEHALPTPGLVEALQARLDETHRRVDEEIAAGEHRSHATERAIRKGLAGLGERLVASEQAYLEAGSALRRSIERLGAAVVEADARIAGEPLDPPAVGYVAFVPTADGYRLTALDGLVPELGAIVELDGLDGAHRAARITRSPLPLDRRRCVYLERVV